MLLSFIDERTRNDSAENTKITKSLQHGINTTLSSAGKAAETLSLSLPNLQSKKQSLLKTIVSFNAAQTNGLIECARIPQAQTLSNMFTEFGKSIKQAKEEIDDSCSIAGKLEQLSSATPQLIAQARTLILPSTSSADPRMPAGLV